MALPTLPSLPSLPSLFMQGCEIKVFFSIGEKIFFIKAPCSIWPAKSAMPADLVSGTSRDHSVSVKMTGWPRTS